MRDFLFPLPGAVSAGDLRIAEGAEAGKKACKERILLKATAEYGFIRRRDRKKTLIFQMSLKEWRLAPSAKNFLYSDYNSFNKFYDFQKVAVFFRIWT